MNNTAQITSAGAPPRLATRNPKTNPPSDIARLAINIMDAVQVSNSGHPGSPMGMAPTAYLLWQRFLRFDPAEPTFVLARE